MTIASLKAGIDQTPCSHPDAKTVMISALELRALIRCAELLNKVMDQDKTPAQGDVLYDEIIAALAEVEKT